MLRFLHAADFHLDSAFHALPLRLAAERRQESRELLNRLAEEALRREADLVLLAGDLFDGGTVYRETLEALAAALGRMKVPVLIAPGNHDYYNSASPYARDIWPENVHIFRSAQVEAVELPALGCVAYGAAFVSPEQAVSPLAGFSQEGDGGRRSLMVLHGNVGAGEGCYGPVTRQEIAGSGLHYLALGHVHTASGLQRERDTYWAYPGCPEGRGFDELGEKGCYFGVLDDGGGVALTFVPLARRRYEILQTDVTGRPPLEAVEAALPPDTAGDLYRILLTGETGEEGVDLPALTAALEGRFYALELRDCTQVRQDVWARAGEDSLRGLFLRRLRQMYEVCGSQEEREQVVRAVRFGLAALDHRDIL